MNKEYPKILIAGFPLNKVSGDGITKTNLFGDWPLDKLAIISTRKDYIDTRYCRNFYIIGKKEKRKWSIFDRYIQNSEYFHHTGDFGIRPTENSEIKAKKPLRKMISRILNFSIGFVGLHHKQMNYFVSPDLLLWIEKFNPDYIYTSLHSLEFTRFIKELHGATNIPLAIHIMDDWMESTEPFGLFYFYWKRRTHSEFKGISRIAKVRMSICHPMSREYEKRYGLTFEPFHNPLDLTFWRRHQKKKWTKTGDVFKILYAGRIGPGTYHSVYRLAKVINRLNRHYNIEFQVQSLDTDPLLLKLDKIESVNLLPIIEYDRLPEKFSSVDLLVMPIDFEKRGMQYLRFSMPTKTSEYMISGTPVLVFSPPGTALCEYAREEKWAFVVDEYSEKKLRDMLIKIIEDSGLRENFARRAIEIAEQNHCDVVVKEKFRKEFAH